MLKKIFEFIFPPDRTDWDQVIEGVYADQYSDHDVRARIRRDYVRRWQQKPTPATAPLKFNPLRPPPGWRYDPYYEIWLKIGD